MYNLPGTSIRALARNARRGEVSVISGSMEPFESGVLLLAFCWKNYRVVGCRDDLGGVRVDCRVSMRIVVDLLGNVGFGELTCV